MSEPLKERAEIFFHEFMDTYTARGPNVLEKCLGFFSPEFLGHGTELLETFFNISDVETQFAKEFQLIPDPATLSFKFVKSSVHGNTVILLADMFIMFQVGDQLIEIDPFRALAVIRESDDRLQFIGLSTSYYDNQLPGESPIKGFDEPKHYEEVTVLFADFQKFTNMVGTIPAKKLVNELRDIFSEFDDIIKQNGLHKIKTIGDAYMAVAGLDPDSSDHGIDSVNASNAMIRFINERNSSAALKWDLRIGLHSGSVVGGMVGTHGITFDIFGDTVNIASRVESASEPGRICLSAYTYDLVKDYVDCEYRGKIDAKGKGEMDMYWVKIS